MSLWDRFFAPGDLRRRQRDLEDLQRLKVLAARTAPPKRAPRISATERVRRQNAMFYGGLVFTGLSVFVTRRSMRRKIANAPPPPPATAQISLKPATDATGEAVLKPQLPPGTKTDGAFEAVEALGLATLNIASFTMLFVGSVMKYFDVADVDDLRNGLRSAAGLEGDGSMVDSEADREIETWIAETLAQKDAKTEGKGLREGVLEKLAEIERDRKAKGGR